MLREIIVIAVAGSIFFGAGWIVNGWRKNEQIAQIHADYNSKRAEAEAQARDKEQNLIDQATALRKNKDAEIATVSRRLNSTLAGLRTRPERTGSQVPSASGTCAGTSGAELARGDGQFLAGYAADAAKLSAALDQCEAQYNQVRNTH